MYKREKHADNERSHEQPKQQGKNGMRAFHQELETMHELAFNVSGCLVQRPREISCALSRFQECGLSVPNHSVSLQTVPAVNSRVNVGRDA